MSHRASTGRKDFSYPRESFRLTFRYTKEGIELVSQERLPMIAPPAVGEPPQAKVNGGTWIELHNARDERITARVISDPFRTHTDHHSPDGRIEHYHRDITEGQFDVLIPAVDDIASVSLVSSEFTSTDRAEGAVEIARFQLDRIEKGRAV